MGFFIIHRSAVTSTSSSSATREVFFRAEKGKVYAYTTGQFTVQPKLEQITILGVDKKPTQVSFNGKTITNFSYEADKHRLVVTELEGDLNNGWELDY